jgi:peptidyl-prolyl cis-trans isomerase B (cyclophilin B)
MNKLSIWVFVGILTAFGGILFVTQSQYSKNTAQSPASTVPTLPPDSATFKMISQFPLNGDQQAQQQQQQQQQQAQAAQAQPQVEEQQQQYGAGESMKASYSATIKTSKGDIEVMLSSRDAPNTVKNFIIKAQTGFYKNLTFHRVEDWVIQGGDPQGTGAGGGLMQTELNNLQFVPGSLGVARGSDIRVSNDSQFFIVKKEAFWLNQQYTNFGIVTSGMDVVNSMQIGDKILGITINQ